MSVTLDETARDPPVRDMDQRKGAVFVMQDKQHVFRSQEEDECFNQKDKNILLKQYPIQTNKPCKRLFKLKDRHPGSTFGSDVTKDDKIKEMEVRIATLENQKEVLQKKLSMARQQILAFGRQPPYRLVGRAGRNVQVEEEVRQEAQTNPSQYLHSTMKNSREHVIKHNNTTDSQQFRAAEIRLASESLREALKQKEKELELILKENSLQVGEHRLVIKENIDVIRLQKQLCDKKTALWIIQEKFTILQEAFETQLKEGQRSLQESQEALLEKVEQLSEQLKEEKQKVLTLEGQLSTATLSLQSSKELQGRITLLEEERNLLKMSYDALLLNMLSVQDNQGDDVSKENQRQIQIEKNWNTKVHMLEEKLKEERREREKLGEEKENLKKEVKEYERSLVEKENEMAKSTAIRSKLEALELQNLKHTQHVAVLQNKLDRVTNDFDMSVEDLTETLIQIKAFRLQQQSCENLGLISQETAEDSFQQLAALQASHTETVLELQKARDLLVMHHRLFKDLQVELRLKTESAEKDQDANKKQITEKNQLLNNMALQITKLKAQLKKLAYSPKNWSHIPQQYAPMEVNREVIQLMKDTASITQEGETLLEIHLIGVTFTSFGLRLIRQQSGHVPDDVVTFCTYTFLDFEMHATPLVAGTQPKYDFRSCYSFSGPSVTRSQKGFVHVDLHQSLGGVQFITLGTAKVLIMDLLQYKTNQAKGTANITGSQGQTVAVLEISASLYCQMEPHDIQSKDKTYNRWSHEQPQNQDLKCDEGRVNKLMVILENFEHWPGNKAYLTYRLYDLQPHSTSKIPCSRNPVFTDSITYSLAVTPDLIKYLKTSSMLIYMFDDDEDQTSSSYLAKTAVSLKPLSAGRMIKGDYIFRDPEGTPKAKVRVRLQWRYPFHSYEASDEPTRNKDKENMENTEKWSVTAISQRPVPKPRLKAASMLRCHENVKDLAKGKEKAANDQWKSMDHRSQNASESQESLESSASDDSDVIVTPESTKLINKMDRLKVEILSLLLYPSSSVALDQSVQQVYVEYCLLGVPMDTTETPMSLRKPTGGEEIHYNFGRVIHVDATTAGPLRNYLYTMLEGTDANQGRLKFTVVSEPLFEEQEEECVAVGQAYLDLRKILLKGNDLIEQQIDIFRKDAEQEIVGKLTVSIEAVQALTGIYWEYRSQKEGKRSQRKRR